MDLRSVRRPYEAAANPGLLSRCRARLWRLDRAREVEVLRNRDQEVRALLPAALRKLEDQP